jgi:pimeloyl-ACP methyl ester carboxylesterase
MRRAARLALLAFGSYAPYLAAQECPPRPAPYIRPSLTSELQLAGTWRAPWEFVCGAPLTVRIHQSGRQLTATVQAPASCEQAGQERWSGTMRADSTTFPVRAVRRAGGVAATVAGTATLVDRCTLDVRTGGIGATRFERTDGECASDQPRAVVVFIGGALDDWNRNLQRVFCAYDAQGERTRKLYYLHSDARERMLREVLQAAGGAPIVLVGHSYGADAAYHLAGEINAAGDSVDLLVTLDPVSSFGQDREVPRPPGVRRWVNVRVGSGVGLSSCGLVGRLGGQWAAQPAADADLRFPPDPARDDPDDDHCKTEEMFLLDPVQSALGELR